MNVYEMIPVLENDAFRLRSVEKQDAAALTAVYGDKNALPFFNSDNCHGDIFFYDTLEKMEKAIDFWEDSYRNGWFVRWAIEEKQFGRLIGTVECCKRGESTTDTYGGMGILRVDVASLWEKAEVLSGLVALLLPKMYDWFDCTALMTKAPVYAVERIRALQANGFVPGDGPVVGEHDEMFRDYWVRKA